MGSLTAPGFVDLVGDKDEFFSTYFNKRPMVRPGALAGDVARDVLSTAMLDDLLASDAIRPPYVAVTKGGELVHGRTYTETRRVQRDMITDAIVPERVIEHFKTGATITWSSLNHYIPHIREITRELSDMFGTRSDAVGFVTPAGRRGFKPHRDSVDVFVIQTEGTKDWLLWNPSDERDGLADWYSLDELGEPDYRVTLEPGDVLYLPFGTPHCAAATEFISVHVSLMVKPRRWRDLLVDIVTEAVATDPAFAGYPLLQKSNGDFEAELRSAGEALSRRIATTDWREAITSLRSVPEASVGSTKHSFFSTLSAADGLESTHILTRHDKTDVAVEKESADGHSRLRVNGSVYKVPSAAVDTVGRLKESAQLRVGDLPGSSDGDRIELARALVRLQVVNVTAARA